MPRIRHLTAPALAGVLLLAACGDDSSSGDAAGAESTRTVEIEMVDIAFESETIRVEPGETVRFVFTNGGEVAHDAYIGDADAQADHEAEMRDGGGMGHGGHGAEVDAITVEPGGTGELTHTFTRPGSFEIGCHQPGHYDAGMKVDIEVA